MVWQGDIKQHTYRCLLPPPQLVLDFIFTYNSRDGKREKERKKEKKEKWKKEFSSPIVWRGVVYLC